MATQERCGYCGQPGTSDNVLVDDRPRVFVPMHATCVAEYLQGSAWRRQPTTEVRP